MRYLTYPIVATAAATLALAACGQSQDSGNAAATANTAVTNAAAPAVSSGDTAILAAAEPFEKLTETAFSATPAVLDATITEARAAAAGVRRYLTSIAATRLDERLAAIAAAHSRNDRAELAIAAVEGYRVLVSDVSTSAKVPTAVNLLDYAGFRYDADLKARPTRWADMTQAASFGREQWASISQRVTDTALRARMDKTLADMVAAANSRNASAAATAAQRELGLVDDLERFFSAR